MRSNQIITGVLCVATLALAFAVAAAPVAATPEKTLKTANVCAREAAARERIDDIPGGYLRAITVVETGRWDDARKASFAWPWTVTAEGEGKYYPTKAAAIRAVRDLRDRGLTNIDIGCMQINLHYHGDAFDSLAEGFEPSRNIAYAAEFLNRLRERKKSWTRAIQFYHSSIPEHQQRYYRKIRHTLSTMDAHEPAARRVAAAASRHPKYTRPKTGRLRWKPIPLRRSAQTHRFVRKAPSVPSGQTVMAKSTGPATPDWAQRRAHDPVRAALRLRPFKP
ncbi:MAG: hypothetical protein HOM25_15650 [Rhodospirillaceae bacterium]|jgi:hypothetical protein|nr:hypothetical protein [Rhodospirillaceae bacterium]